MVEQSPMTRALRHVTPLLRDERSLGVVLPRGNSSKRIALYVKRARDWLGPGQTQAVLTKPVAMTFLAHRLTGQVPGGGASERLEVTFWVTGCTKRDLGYVVRGFVRLTDEYVRDGKVMIYTKENRTGVTLMLTSTRWQLT